MSKRPWPLIARPAPSPTEAALAECLRTAWAEAERLADRLAVAEARILYLETARLYRRAAP